mmetsp:Transcript_218/g.607  ORF Transcript_218/g.607 Transcript_218/m.607 type:complete len:250 (+) Transcript_218:153-902(+)
MLLLSALFARPTRTILPEDTTHRGAVSHKVAVLAGRGRPEASARRSSAILVCHKHGEADWHQARQRECLNAWPPKARPPLSHRHGFDNLRRNNSKSAATTVDTSAAPACAASDPKTASKCRKVMNLKARSIRRSRHMRRRDLLSPLTETRRSSATTLSTLASMASTFSRITGSKRNSAVSTGICRNASRSRLSICFALFGCGRWQNSQPSPAMHRPAAACKQGFAQRSGCPMVPGFSKRRPRCPLGGPR